MHATCGARSKRTGRPCPLAPVPGKTRCKWHGGASTGPRTEAGKTAARLNGKKGGHPRKPVVQEQPQEARKKPNPMTNPAHRCRDCAQLSAGFTCLAAARGEVAGGADYRPALGEFRYCPAFLAA
jgi:hypothetical protein